MDFKGLYDIRPALPEDYNFIVATWLRGLYYGNEFFGLIDKSAFMRDYKPIINAILVHPNVIIRVACLKEDHNVILGYSICSVNDSTIFWAFVKVAWRRQGIGKSILPANPSVATHFTTLSLELMKKYPNLKFNPFQQV